MNDSMALIGFVILILVIVSVIRAVYEAGINARIVLKRRLVNMSHSDLKDWAQDNNIEPSIINGASKKKLLETIFAAHNLSDITL